ncbi:MAG: MipA/OmpV family protein, partial [Deltaproteobacteria bacterium]|nr:MipA/OmpV family protein [Deltaproteobacteria bacterium]
MKKKLGFEIAMVFFALICVVCIGLPSTSSAAGPELSVGAGAAFVPEFEGSEDYEAFPALFFSAKWPSGYFIKLSGNAIRANLAPSEVWHVGPVLQYRKKRDDDVDSKPVSRMREIDETVEGGLFLGFEIDNWDASFQWVADLSDEHDGSLATLAGGYSFRMPQMTIRIGVSSTYADDDYMETYFSVDAKDAIRSGLPKYSADSGIKDIGVDLTLRYAMNDKWDLMGLLDYT